MPLKIRYRSAFDEVSERIISEVEASGPHHLSAYCHLRGEARTFRIDRIESALDLATGQPVADLRAHFGLQGEPGPPQMPSFPETRQRLSTADAQQLRKADKRALFARFKVEPVMIAKRRELDALFGGRCFACGIAGRLELDHHIPQQLGGRLVPGNVVLLCAPCNMAKGTRHPGQFYTAAQLDALRPILEAQLRLFDFRFDWDRWRGSPLEYLLALGVPRAEAETAIAERDAARDDGLSVSISIE